MLYEGNSKDHRAMELEEGLVEEEGRRWIWGGLHVVAVRWAPPPQILRSAHSE